MVILKTIVYLNNSWMTDKVGGGLNSSRGRQTKLLVSHWKTCHIIICTKIHHVLPKDKNTCILENKFWSYHGYQDSPYSWFYCVVGGAVHWRNIMLFGKGRINIRFHWMICPSHFFICESCYKTPNKHDRHSVIRAQNYETYQINCIHHTKVIFHQTKDADPMMIIIGSTPLVSKHFNFVLASNHL